jgi:hypothetical protein
MNFTALIAMFIRHEWSFTGTRKGMTVEQKAFGRRLMSAGKLTRFSHGGAYGSDFEMHATWRELAPNKSTCDVWPASEDRARLFERQARVTVHPVMYPLDRNIKIVHHCTLLIAAPHTQKEEQGSGTWHTIRAGFHVKRPVLILWPNGLLTLCLENQLIRIYG